MNLELLTSIRGLELPAEEKLLLMVLASYTNGEMKCWPGVATLATDCGKKRRIIQRQLKRLEDKGLALRSHRHNTSSIFDLSGVLQYTSRGVPQDTVSSTPAHSSTPRGVPECALGVHSSTQEVTREVTKEVKRDTTKDSKFWLDIKSRWNSVAGPSGLRKTKSITAKHKSEFKARTKEFRESGEGEFFEALLAALVVPLDDYAKGKTSKSNWKINLAYALRADGSALILEGHYAFKGPQQFTPQRGSPMAVMDEFNVMQDEIDRRSAQ